MRPASVAQGMKPSPSTSVASSYTFLLPSLVLGSLSLPAISLRSLLFSISLHLDCLPGSPVCLFFAVFLPFSFFLLLLIPFASAFLFLHLRHPFCFCPSQVLSPMWVEHRIDGDETDCWSHDLG